MKFILEVTRVFEAEMRVAGKIKKNSGWPTAIMKQHREMFPGQIVWLLVLEAVMGNGINCETVMAAELEHDKNGRPTFEDWIKKGEYWMKYPTGYVGKRFGELTADQRRDLAKACRGAAKRFEAQADAYEKYANGDPGPGADIGPLESL